MIIILFKHVGYHGLWSVRLHRLGAYWLYWVVVTSIALVKKGLDSANSSLFTVNLYNCLLC
jgi:hypothetical protein